VELWNSGIGLYATALNNNSHNIAPNEQAKAKFLLQLNYVGENTLLNTGICTEHWKSESLQADDTGHQNSQVHLHGSMPLAVGPAQL
jgi:hypothetical protein